MRSVNIKRSGGPLAMAALAGAIRLPVYADTSDVPQSFLPDVQCMTNALQNISGVDQIQLGGLYQDGWTHPFVQYRFQEKDGRTGVVRFVAEKSKTSAGGVEYLAILGGLSMHGGPPPPRLGTREVTEEWERQCHIRATALLE